MDLASRSESSPAGGVEGLTRLDHLLLGLLQRLPARWPGLLVAVGIGHDVQVGLGGLGGLAGGGDEAERTREGDGLIQLDRVVMHSLAFGSLVPFLADDPKDAVDRKKMEMTQDVMANSLVYWVQDLYRGGFLDRGSKIYAMTSEGTSRVVPSYGVVSGAKAAMESHIRQLAMEFARRDTGIAVNSIRAGVTDTPALRKIPENQRMIDITLARNPHGRMTTTQDVADAIVTLQRDRFGLDQRQHHLGRRRRVRHGLIRRRRSGPRWMATPRRVATAAARVPRRSGSGGTAARGMGRRTRRRRADGADDRWQGHARRQRPRRAVDLLD